jgi:hypothetical protein
MDGFQSAGTPELGALPSLTEVMSYGCVQIPLPARPSENLQTNSDGVREIRQNSTVIMETHGGGLTHQCGEILLPHPSSATLAGCGMKQSTEKRSFVRTEITADASRLLASCGPLSVSRADAARLATKQSLIVATANTSIVIDESHLSLPMTLWLPTRGLRLDYQIHHDGGLQLNQDFRTSRR